MKYVAAFLLVALRLSVSSADEPAELNSLRTRAAKHPGVLQRLTAQLDRIIKDGRSRTARQP